MVSYTGIKRRLFAALPTPVRVQGRSYFRNCVLDVREYLMRQVDPETPPHRLNTSGEGPFRLYGQNTVDVCRNLAELKPDDSFIDLGCGIGRTALALADFLLPSTPYLGFDVIRFAVEWCSRRIGRRHPNFRFVHSNVHNWVYNPRGRVMPEEYRFPAEGGQFHFALANSLFTHLPPPAAANYISEAARVLRPGGRFVSSWFVLDASTEAGGVAESRFAHRTDHGGFASLHAPEQAVAFQRDWMERTFADAGFAVEVRYGTWSGVTPQAEIFQDVVVARRL